LQTLEVGLGGPRAYPVWIGQGLLGDPGLWRQALGSGPAVVVSNEVVAPLYLETVREALGAGQTDLAVETLVLPDGEQHKNEETWRAVIDFLAERGVRRDASLVALGGGVIGDLAGFAAASWMRGIRFVQAPTTLLAQVDASVGGKTAINIPQGKNLVGAFHQPAAVLIDVSTLTTLPEREYRAGLAEVVKYGAIRDLDFITDLEAETQALRDRDLALLEAVVARSVAHKAAVVAADELEQGVRATLNFGHTFGHALETETGYERYLHGEAVAIGMVAAARLSTARGLLEAGFAERLAGLLHALGLPIAFPADIAGERLLAHMRLDKKNRAGQQRLVLLERPGHAIVDAASREDQILAAIEASRGDPHREPETEFAREPT
jgi:3-dehydroquinate synthase